MCNNFWSKIHDFTPLKEDPNWSVHRVRLRAKYDLSTVNASFAQYSSPANPAWVDQFFITGPQSELAVDVSTESSCVPLTYSPSNRMPNEVWLIGDHDADSVSVHVDLVIMLIVGLPSGSVPSNHNFCKEILEGYSLL